MNIERKLKEFENQKNGNLVIRNNIFISEKNMAKIVDIIKDCKKNTDMFITPYLVNVSSNTICELLNYEFSVDVYDNVGSDIKQYHKDNLLPEEITSSLIPGIVTNKDDYEFVIKHLNNYFTTMKKMKFCEVRNSDIRMKDALLYFQIF